MTTRVAAYNGEADPFVPAEDIEAFKAEMDKAGAHCDFVQLPGAVHAFTNPDADTLGAKFNLPLKYDADADAKSWAQMQQFFNKIFAK